MTNRVEVLDWDSEFFGVPIGRVVLDDVDGSVLAEIDEEAKDRGLVCLFGTLSPGVGDASMLVQAHGYLLVEANITFDRQPGPLATSAPTPFMRPGTPDDVLDASKALDALAPWSRFAVDERFGLPSARRLHEAWLTRAVENPDERMFIVAQQDDRVTGAATAVRSNPPRLDLVGVVSGGAGEAYHLASAFIDWAGEAATEAGPSAARNIRILRFLQNCGFKVERTTYAFHRWLDDQSRARA